MAIFSPSEWAALPVPKNPLEAVPVMARQYACQVGRAINYWGHTLGIQAAQEFARNFPLSCPSFIPLLPYDRPPVYVPNLGGQCNTAYRVKVVGEWLRGDGFSQTQQTNEAGYPGPISALYIVSSSFSGGTSLSVRFNYGPSSTVVECFSINSSAPPNDAKYLYYKFSVLSRVDGQADNCGNPPPVVLPPVEPPPGIDPYPAPPNLPPGGGDQPVKPDTDSPDAPPYYIPWTVPPIIIPIAPIIAPQFKPNLSVPITIPVNIPIQFSPNITGTINVQIGPDGNIRTPPDLLCECEYQPEPPDGPVTCPDTTLFNIPFYSCTSGGSFEEEVITVVSDSLPSGLFEKLLSSANLAEVGCESLTPDQEPESLIDSGRSGDVIVEPQYSAILPEEVVSVEIRLSNYSQEEYRELTTFPGGGQRKFGAVSYCLADSEGGACQVYLWDEKTYYRLPRRLKSARMKIMLRPGISWQLWDTGERG